MCASMATKKRRQDEPMNDEEDDSYDEELADGDQEEDSDSEEMDITGTTVQVEFEARNAEDCDFHGIRKLLQQLFLKANVNLSEMTDTIISQNYIGSVIKQSDMPEDDESDDDDGDVFGVISVINMSEKKDMDCIQQLRGMLLERCAACDSKQGGGKAGCSALTALLDNPANQVGLLLNERFINIPPQIALPSFEALWKEVDHAVRKKMKYDFTHVLMVCKTYKSQAGPVFINAEEELFVKENCLQFEYSVASERDTVVGGKWDDEEEEMEPCRCVVVVPRPRVPVIMSGMRDLLSLPPT